MARATDARADGEIAYRSAEAIANDTRAGRNVLLERDRTVHDCQFVVVVGTLLAGRSRVVAVLSGLSLLGASTLTRFGVLEAGIESTKDPRHVIEPQRARLAERRAQGITDDSITTGW